MPPPIRRSRPRKAADVPPPKPAPVFEDRFDAAERADDRWHLGVLATPGETIDYTMTAEQSHGTLRITPAIRKQGVHFSGYVSIDAFNLTTATIVTELRQPAAGGATTIFAAGIDASNWIGFRIEGSQLSFESRTAGRTAFRKTEYDTTQHRFLRLRVSTVAPVVVWETSADGANWSPEYVETSALNLRALHISLNAGTEKRIENTTPAIFARVAVERKP